MSSMTVSEAASTIATNASTSASNTGTVETNQPSNAAASESKNSKNTKSGILMYPAGLLQNKVIISK